MRLRDRFRRKPRPQPSAAPQPQLPKAAAPQPAPEAKVIGPKSPVADLVTCIGPGVYRVLIHKNRPVYLTHPFDHAMDLTLDKLLKDDGSLAWPVEIAAPVKRKTVEEVRAERVAVIRRLATGPRGFAALLENEGFNPAEYPWEEPTTEQRQTLTAARRAREVLGLLRARIFGKG